MTTDGVLTGVSVSHRLASVDQIEAAYAESQRVAVESLLSRPGVREALCLQTCNRVEAYVVTDDADAGREALAPVTADVPDEGTVVMDHEASLRHLMRVAAGLESLVLGEDQILGQVRTAYEEARGAGGVGPVLENGVTKAIHVGERARTETAINEGTVSVGSAAVEFAREERDLDEATALVVGAGEMGALVAGALDGEVDRILVANRTVPRAEHLAAEVEADADAVALEALPGAIDRADVVFSATGSQEPVVDRETLAGAGDTLVVDIAQPRDVTPGAVDVRGVTVRDIDALESVTDASRERRERAAEGVERMIDEEFERLLTQYKRERADEVIGAMYESAERTKARELRTAFEKLDLDDEQREVVESMADALVNQLLAPPTKSLRDAAEEDDWSTIHTALQLFDPDFGADPPPFLDGLDPEEPPGNATAGAPGGPPDRPD